MLLCPRFIQFDERGGYPEIFQGFGLIALTGTLFGTMVMPLDDNLNGFYYKYISNAIGYTYTLAWSISFYPQVISNYSRSSTVGLSADFVLLNLFGFVCYATFNAAFYWSEAVMHAYQNRHENESETLVQFNDVIFAFHAVLICVITLGQVVYYGDGSSSSIGSRESTVSSSIRNPSPLVRYFLISILLASVFYALLIILTRGGVGEASCENGNKLCQLLDWLDFLYMLSFIKLLITITKYIPQVILNHKRQSTDGWSIWAILLDFMGGILSMLQLVLDCYNLNDWSGISGDPAKLGLGFISIIFDVIFFVQHYILYRRSESNAMSEYEVDPGCQSQRHNYTPVYDAEHHSETTHQVSKS